MKRNQTTNEDGSEAGKSSERGSGLVSAFAREDRIADANALLFHAVEEAARPYEFRGEETKAESDCQPPWAWRDEHDDAQCEKREAEEDLQEALRMLERLKEHRINPNPSVKPTSIAVPNVRCGSTDPGCKRARRIPSPNDSGALLQASGTLLIMDFERDGRARALQPAFTFEISPAMEEQNGTPERAHGNPRGHKPDPRPGSLYQDGGRLV